MSEKIYIVRALESGVSLDDAFDFNVGYTLTLEEAQAACKRLKEQNDQAIDFWNKHGCKCTVGCECWPSADDPKAIAALMKARSEGCPLAKLELKEIFYGKDATSGGFEVTCANKCDKCCDPITYDYVIEELEKL